MILVTGGCGYIGSHIVKTLSESGEKVIVFDNLSHGTRQALLHHDQLIIGDISDASALEQVFVSNPIDTVIHLAALVNATESNSKKLDYIAVNEMGSQNVWELAFKYNVHTVLYASSAAVYGVPNSHSPISENHPTHPTNVYGATKLAGEKSLHSPDLY